LSIDEHIAHRKRLGHAYDGVIDRRIAVRMVFTNDVTDNPGRFLVWLVVVIAELSHRVQDSAVYRFQAIADIRQRTTHDDAHRVVEIGLLHLLFEAYGQQFLGYFRHTISTRFTQNPSGAPPFW
jgi:hypothetical protein